MSHAICPFASVAPARGKNYEKIYCLFAKFTNSVGGNNALISLKARGFPLPGEPVTGQTEHRQMMPNL